MRPYIPEWRPSFAPVISMLKGWGWDTSEAISKRGATGREPEVVRLFAIKKSEIREIANISYQSDTHDANVVHSSKEAISPFLRISLGPNFGSSTCLLFQTFK